MPKFGLSAPLGGRRFGPARAPFGYGVPKRVGMGFGYMPILNKRHGYSKMFLAARKIQKIFRGSSIRRKFPVKLFAKMRRTGRFARPNFRLSTLYK